MQLVTNRPVQMVIGWTGRVVNFGMGNPVRETEEGSLQLSPWAGMQTEDEEAYEYLMLFGYELDAGSVVDIGTQNAA